MKRKILLISVLLLFVYLIIGCGNEEGSQFKKVRYEKMVGDCQNDICVNIDLSYYQMTGETDAATSFNKLMDKMVFGKMAYSEDSGMQNKDELVTIIIKDYQDFKKEFPDARTGGYEQETESEITYESKSLITFKVVTNLYSGGAHSSHIVEFLNIDPETGTKKNILDIISNKARFNVYVEKLLRKKLKMSDTDKWEDFTFMDKFNLPENIGMTSKGLDLVYNEYELLPYSEGITTLIIDNDKLEEFSKSGK
jgi:hypothetical protein